MNRAGRLFKASDSDLSICVKFGSLREKQKRYNGPSSNLYKKGYIGERDYFQHTFPGPSSYGILAELAFKSLLVEHSVEFETSPMFVEGDEVPSWDFRIGGQDVDVKNFTQNLKEGAFFAKHITDAHPGILYVLFQTLYSVPGVVFLGHCSHDTILSKSIVTKGWGPGRHTDLYYLRFQHIDQDMGTLWGVL
jgi:hypothetical protein